MKSSSSIWYNVKETMKIFALFVAFLENINFTRRPKLRKQLTVCLFVSSFITFYRLLKTFLINNLCFETSLVSSRNFNARILNSHQKMSQCCAVVKIVVIGYWTYLFLVGILSYCCTIVQLCDRRKINGLYLNGHIFR